MSKSAQTERLETVTRKTAELVRDERGASFIEYVIVCGLVAIAAITAFNNFGGAVRTRIDAERAAIEGMPNP